MCAGGLGGDRGPPPTTTSTSPALNSLLHLTPNICLLLWRPPSTCRRSFHTCHKFFSRGDKLYDAATLLLSCASICAAPPLTRETRLAAFVSLNITLLRMFIIYIFPNTHEHYECYYENFRHKKKNWRKNVWSSCVGSVYGCNDAHFLFGKKTN